MAIFCIHEKHLGRTDYRGWCGINALPNKISYQQDAAFTNRITLFTFILASIHGKRLHQWSNDRREMKRIEAEGYLESNDFLRKCAQVPSVALHSNTTKCFAAFFHNGTFIAWITNHVSASCYEFSLHNLQTGLGVEFSHTMNMILNRIKFVKSFL